MTFQVKDSGQREAFETGALRDTQDDKPRYDLIPIIALKRIANLYAKGAKKYGERNFEKGIPSSRYIASLMRHLFQYLEGDKEEDHAAAVCFNILGIMYNEEAIRRDLLPQEIHDLKDYNATNNIS